MDASQAMQLMHYLPIYFQVTDTLTSTRTLLAVAMGVVVWEHLSTMHYEYRYLWRSFSYFNVLVLLNRYTLLAIGTTTVYLAYWPNSQEACDRIYKILYLFPMFGYLIANTIMTVRVVSLWNKSRVILVVLVCLMIAMVIIQSYIPSRMGSKAQTLPPGIPQLGIPDIKGCFPNAGLSYWLFFLGGPCFDSVVFALSLTAVLKIWHRGGRSAVVKALLGDGAMWFGISFSVNLANLIYYASTPSTGNRALLGGLATSIQSIAATRMTFSLRHSAAKAQSSSLQISTGSIGSRIAKLAKIKLPGSSRSHSDLGNKSGDSAGPETDIRITMPVQSYEGPGAKRGEPWEDLELGELRTGNIMVTRHTDSKEF